MSVLATILEWALLLSLIKVFARDLLQCLVVLFNERFLVRPVIHHVVTWDNHIRIFTANWARSEVVLRRALIIRCTPATNAFQAESVVTPVQDAELLAVGQHHLQANLALLVVFFDIGLFFGRAREVASVATFGMQVLTCVTIPAIALRVELTNYLLFI